MTAKGRFVAALLLALVAFGCADRLATAQTGRNPFAMAGGEAAGAATGLAGTILAWQNKFHIELQSAAKALKTSGSAFWTLAGASFAYGVFHAAGPGHGKAVLASYMIASETALRRGMILAALAALLQGCVAIGLVGAAAALLGATAMQMKSAANTIELASYGAIALLGAGLVWKKGRAFFAALRAPPDIVASRGGFYCEAVDDPSHVHSASCGHLHAVDPTTLERDFGGRRRVAPLFRRHSDSCLHSRAGQFLGRRERRFTDVGRHGHHDRIFGRLRGVRAANGAAMERSRSALGLARRARSRIAGGGARHGTGPGASRRRAP
jgi:hypothetical protein